MKKHRVEIKWQVIVFGIYAILGLIQAYSEHPAEGIYLREILGVFNVVISQCLLVNILANWLMLKYPFSREPVRYSVYLILIFIVNIFYRYITAFPDYNDLTSTYNGNQNKNSIVFFVFISTINSVISFLVALGIYSIKKSIRMEARARRLETEVSQARLDILKHQINPHFLYNTLSYMYSQARPVSENLSKSILMLSEMMRYSLNKTDENGLTLIEKEIQYIDNFIEIHRLRFENDFYVNFEVEGLIGNKKIVPLLLITFVENAIKHGVLNDASKPVNITLLIEKETLYFTVENHKQKGHKDETSGIGLENTKKRLQLVYGNRHDLEIKDDVNHFTVRLKILFE
jgi:two-component system, LytTR family, sensor kinase